MFLQKLALKNFKSFYNETVIDFTELQGLWRVSGQIGSGKTSIGEAIIFGLYGKISDKNNASLISWGQKHALVELWCQSRGHSLYIRREINAYGQSPMTVEVDGEPIIFTDKRSAQEQLEQDYLDAPRTSMELLCIISFNNFKSLSTLNAKDTKQFLDNVLGFDVLTKYKDAVKVEQQKIHQALLRTEAEIHGFNAQIDRMENYVFIDGDAAKVEEDIQALKADMNIYKSTKTAELAPFQTELTKLQKSLSEVVALGKLKKKEIDFIKRGICPTCGATIDSSHLEVKIRERENLAEQYTQISARISDLQSIITNISSDLDKYIGEKLSCVKSQENELIKLQEQSKMTVLNRSEIRKLKKQVKTLEDTATEYQTVLSKYAQLSNIFEVQIRQTVLESFIPAINNKITEIAGMLNMRFIPQYDSMFKCSVVMGGETVPISALSTGQLKMVDVIIILAILSSLISKVQSNVIFLDELFSNLDPRTRAELVVVLRSTLPTQSSILIISHQDMDTDIFDGHIKMRLERLAGTYESTVVDIHKQ